MWSRFESSLCIAQFDNPVSLLLDWDWGHVAARSNIDRSHTSEKEGRPYPAYLHNTSHHHCNKANKIIVAQPRQYGPDSNWRTNPRSSSNNSMEALSGGAPVSRSHIFEVPIRQHNQTQLASWSTTTNQRPMGGRTNTLTSWAHASCTRKWTCAGARLAVARLPSPTLPSNRHKQFHPISIHEPVANRKSPDYVQHH